jgi:rhodanese-related sulfurtransferase
MTRKAKNVPPYNRRVEFNMSTPAEPRPWEIDVASVKQMLDEHADFVLLDCRETSEFEEARIAGARLLPMSEIAQRVEELADQRDRHIVVHCHHGGRSLRVARWLRSAGFPHAQSMAGGIDQWSLTVDSSVPRY